MPQVPPQRLFDFARAVLRREAKRLDRVDDLAPVFEQVFRVLHRRMAPLVGSLATDALLGRALKLAADDYPALRDVTVSNGGGQLFACPAVPPFGVSERREAAEACAAILAHFIHLLTIVIGDLGLGTVQEMWPHVPMESAAARDPAA